VEDEEVPLAEAFRKIREGLEFPPGRYVRHPTFGVGPVLDFDGERVTIDFPKEGRKAMTLAMARRALELLPSEDIRVQLARDPEAVKKEKSGDPPALIVRALRHLGGEGDLKQLREVLCPSVMSEKSWNGWWRKARESCLSDPRIDAAEAYRDAYRLPTEGGREAPLPDLARVREPAEALALMRRLLRDRPEAAEEAGQKYAPLLEKWLGKKDVPPKVRGAALHYLSGWVADRNEEWAAKAARLLQKGMELNELPGAVEQEGFLDLGLASSGFEAAVQAGLSSRYTRVRDRAMAALAERGEEAMEGVFRKELTARDPRALAHVTAWYAAGGEGGFSPGHLHAWRLVPAVFAAVAAGAQATVQKELLALLGSEGPLAKRLAADPCPHDMHGALRMALRSLRTDPALERLGRTFLVAAGGGDALEGDVQEKPAAAPSEAAGFLISRATRHRLEDEAARLTRELNTTIPAAILKAREHGDISENAEYDAAKEKQAHTAGRVAQIQEQLRQAQMLDEAPWEEGTVSPGAYVELDGGEEGARQVWVLGDGEDGVAPEAVSYRSPVGQSLLGLKVGDSVALLREGREITYRVASVERRLPE
jgi:transcription elongation factor GreA